MAHRDLRATGWQRLQELLAALWRHETSSWEAALKPMLLRPLPTDIECPCCRLQGLIHGDGCALEGLWWPDERRDNDLEPL